VSEISKMEGPRTYANLCLTVIAACVIYLSFRLSTTDASPAKVEIVGVASQLDTPIPCKLMFKKRSAYATEWTDEGKLGVWFTRDTSAPKRMQVEIVSIASDIENALPIKTMQEQESGHFGGRSSRDKPIAVRLVGIEKPAYAEWEPIPVRLAEIKKGTLATWNAIPVEADGTTPITVEGTPLGWPINVSVSP